MPLCKWDTFWMVSCLICYFIVILFYIERKWLRNLPTNLPLNSILYGKFQRFNVIDGRIQIWKIVEFPKIWIKMKNFKTFYKAQTASHLKDIIQSPLPPDKIFNISGTNLLSKCFKNVVLGRQEMVQCKWFFWH